MVNTTDLKSVDPTTVVPVQVRPSVPLFEFYRLCEQRLAFLGAIEAQSEAWLLLEHSAGCRRSDLLLRWREPVSGDIQRKVKRLLRLRLTGKPLAYLLGTWW